MNPNKTYYGDSRLTNFCAYCGERAETEDHVPSRCFLDQPYPQNMPVVPCCHKCNHDFSEDEEYVSCLIDCMKYNTVVPDEIPREKTRRALFHSQKLQARIALQKREFAGITVFDIEEERVKKVMRKLAFGHLAYENDTLSWDSTYNISMRLLPEMSDFQKQLFFQPFKGSILPEVCSHALDHVKLYQEDDGDISFSSHWYPVQKGRYVYCVSPDSNRVKFIIADFLAVEVQIIE